MTVLVVLAALGAGNVSADPTSEGLPGAGFLQRLIDWTAQIGLWGSLGSILVGAAMFGLAQQAGNYVGASRGKHIVIGGAIGHNIERNGQRRDDRYYRQQAAYGPAEVERCRVVTDYRSEERVVGYRVAYEYAGRTYQTVTDYHPGSELRVRVQVTPEG